MYNDTTLAKHHAWQRVRAALATAKGIAWDGCHKIYVLMDEPQMEDMEGYPVLIRVTDVDQAFEVLKQWFEDSCGLRFIQSVKTVDGDPNDGYMNLIAQGEFDHEEDH